jgi:hypothetical protein
MPPVTTGSLPAGQFNSSQLPFVDFDDVPIAVASESQGRSLEAKVIEAKAAVRVGRSTL